MLLYAARALLSKTLLTFLRKYLVNVSVEDLIIPTRDKGGWGLTLSNVELREGLVLWTLPGKKEKKISKNASTAASATTTQKQTQQTSNSRQQTQDFNYLPTGPPTRFSTIRSNPYLEHENYDATTAGDCERNEGKSRDESKNQSSQLSSNTNVNDRVEEDMVLRIGHGGRIGTLHVKFVGKELHVTIEDADLVLEVLPSESANSDSLPPSKPGNQQGGPDKKFPVKGGMNENVNSSMKESSFEKTIDTMGERITQKNAIAKFLSIIPHLLLSDCRVRLMVKKLPEAQQHPTRQSSENSSSFTTLFRKIDRDERIQPQKEFVVVLGIDFLSVTSETDDFLAHRRAERVAEDSKPRRRSLFSRFQKQTPSSKSEDGISEKDGQEDVDRNEYLTKRIRTGRGPEGGIWLQILPLTNTPSIKTSELGHLSNVEACWAYHRFVETSKLCLFRCSGVDVHARLLLGPKEDEALRNEMAMTWCSDEYEEYTTNSILFGVDYLGDTAFNYYDDDGSSIDNDEEEEKDEVQYIPIKSNFHRIARGMTRRVCQGDHTPLEDCPLCWETIPSRSHENRECRRNDDDHAMDAQTPLPGFVMCFIVTDPLELNVTRHILESLGVLNSLFSTYFEIDDRAGDSNAKEHSATTGVDIAKEATNSKPESNNGPVNNIASTYLQTGESYADQFPLTMQPDVVNIMGVHLATVIIRFHAMRPGKQSKDYGYSFCYWELVAKLITVDQQRLTATDLPFEDTKISIENLKIYEWKGVCHKELLSIHPEWRSKIQNNSVDVPRLCTASEILKVADSCQRAAPASFQQCALQFRYVMSPTPQHTKSSVATPMKVCDMKIGVFDVNVDWNMMSDISAAAEEATLAIYGNDASKGSADELLTSTERSVSANANGDVSTPPLSIEYKLSSCGGSVNMNYTLRCSIPSTQVIGQKKPTLGLLMEAMVGGGLNLSFKMPSLEIGTVSLLPLAALPDTIRMNILLYLDDLRPLQKALQMKRVANSFMHCHAINKRLGEIAIVTDFSKTENLMNASFIPSITSLSRRNVLMNQLATLNDDTLESLVRNCQQLMS